tara:strand:+ start:267 stop:1058 length:792 start_codon:yes stop_codon:yes gene_type:complete
MAIIYTYPKKNNPTSTDLVLISDSSDGNKTKNATISSIQSLVSGLSSMDGLAGAVLLDSTSAVSNNNLTRTTNAGTNTISYSLDDKLNNITTFEEGTFSPTLQYFDQTGAGTWVDWDKNLDGSTNADRTFPTGNNFSGTYTRINNSVSLRFRCYANNAGAAFDCGGLRIALPYSFNSSNTLALGFTQSLGNVSLNLTSISRIWVSGGYAYLLREEVAAGTDTTVFGANLIPQVYFQTYSTGFTYRLKGGGDTLFNGGGSCQIT